LAPDGTVATPHGAPVVRRSEGVAGAARLLTVREVADHLAVCTATIYSLCERGEIRHLRVSNAIRIHPEDMEAFITSRRG
jgi:excisionase family DNA binding protein